MNEISFDEFLALCDGVIDEGGGNFRALCPCHNDQNPSLYFKRGDHVDVVAYCFVCRDAARIDRIVEALKTGTWATDHKDRTPAKRIPWGRCVAVHTYLRADRTYTYDKLRYRYTDPEGLVHKKTPYRRMPPGSDPGESMPGRGDEPPILYNLPEIAAAEPNRTIYCFEGESDVDEAVALGFTATCTDGGAWPPGTDPGEKWREAFETPLHGFERVVICRDNDPAGLEYARHWASRLHGKVGTVRILTLPGLEEKGDFRDWMANGGTADEFVRLANDAPEWKPTEQPEAKSGQASDPERFTRVVVSAPEFVDKRYPVPRNLVGDGILCAGDLSILYGRPGSGKTWAALQLAIALVRGEPWFGFQTGNGKACRVGILELELHAFRIQERLRALKVDDRDTALRLVSRPDLAGRVDLMSDSDLQALEKWCRDDGLDLLILDALSRIHQADENRDMGKVLGNLDALRHATGTAPKIIHHEPKATSGQGRKIDDLDALRGDSRLQSDPTCLMRFVKLNGGLRTLRFVKVNNAQEPKPIFLSQADDGTFVLTDGPESIKAGNIDRVLAALAKLGANGAKSDAIAAEVELSISTVKGHLATLETDRKAHRTGDGRTTLWWPGKEGRVDA